MTPSQADRRPKGRTRAPIRDHYDVASYRLATHQHWRLVPEMLEEPYAQWEAKQARASEADRDEKWQKLKRVYLQRIGAELMAIIREWGLENDCPNATVHV